MAAGAGGAVKASGLDQETLQKFKVTTSAGVHALPLAEFAALGILNGFKRSAELAQDQAAKVWPELRTPTRLVSGSTLVVTGLGEIGLETARIARALGMKVSGTKRTVEPIEGIEQVADNDGLAGLLATADAVVNTLPGTPFTERLFNREVFAAMKPGTVFVNVGRGTVVDEDALLEALDNGQVSYACLDVFAVEPLPAGQPAVGPPQGHGVAAYFRAQRRGEPPDRGALRQQPAHVPRRRRPAPPRGHRPLLLTGTAPLRTTEPLPGLLETGVPAGALSCSALTCRLRVLPARAASGTQADGLGPKPFARTVTPEGGLPAAGEATFAV